MGLLELTPEVSLIVLATDGLWDVLSDQDACDIAAKALQEHARGKAGGARGPAGGEQGSTLGTDPAATHAADVLVRTSLEVRAL